jgi:Domain of unknown function (DUF6487)
MGTERSSDKTHVPCPICGAPAERGFIFSGNLGDSLRWFDGPLTFWKSITAGSPLASKRGEPIGATGQYCGGYIDGIRCNACNKIVCETVPPNKASS